MTSYERFIDALRDNGCTVIERGNDRAIAQAPGHSPADRSISILYNAIEGRTAFMSFADDKEQVLDTLGLTWADLFDSPKGATYEYGDGRTVHRTPDKKFRQSGNTKGKSLFRAERLADAEAVYVVEGEHDVLAVEAAGGAAVCSAMGAGKAHLFDWEPLRRRRVVVVADKDEPGRKHAAQVAELLAGVATETTVVEAAVGKDAADHIAAGHGLDEFVPTEQNVSTTSSSSDQDDVSSGEEPETSGRRSVAAQLVDMARSHYRLGVTDTDDPFGVTVEAPHIALMLRGGKTGLRAELARRFFAETNTVPSQQALADACMVLEGFAAQENPQRVYLRVAEHAGAAYIDMGDAANRVIEIRGGGWRITSTAPVLFRRTKLTGELPTPQPGKGRQIWDFIGIDEADRPILLAVLVAALIQVDVPHVILLLLAEQGSAKSTVTRILVSLVDPSAVPLRQPPRDPDGWTTAASASWVVALDNLSGEVDGWLSDCLCRASTGDGSVKRALYTDADVSVLAFRRCIIANGVDVSPVRGDLAERVAPIGLPRIATRRAESEFEAEWEAARPAVFGALLDLAAKVHQQLPTIAVDALPRMADFAKVLAAVDKAMGTNGLGRYVERSRRSAADTLDVPFIAELVAACRSHENKTSAELLAEMTPRDTDWRPKRGWPKSSRAVTGLLTRHAPAMRDQGWQVDHDDARSKDKVTRWTIKPPEPEKGCKGDPPNPPNPASQVNGYKSGGLTRAGSPAGYSPNPPGGVAGLAAGQGESADPPDLPGLTCDNGSAGQAGQECEPSLATCGCGTELSRPESIARGCCAECALSANAEAS